MYMILHYNDFEEVRTMYQTEKRNSINICEAMKNMLAILISFGNKEMFREYALTE